MSLGLPNHLARATHSRAIARAAQAAGLVCLCAAIATVLLATLTGETVSTGSGPWPTVIAFIPMGILLAVLSRYRTVAMTIAYLAVGTISTGLYALALLSQHPGPEHTDLFVIGLPIIAMITVGGTGSSALAGVLWSTLGFVLAEVAVLLAAVWTGREFQPDTTALIAYLLLVVVLLLDAFASGGQMIPQTTVHRAVRDDQARRIRHDVVAEFAAEMHDFALSELVAIATSSPGPLRSGLRDRIETDLNALGRDSALNLPAEGGEGVGRDADADELWARSEIRTAIEQARDDGLAVDVSGNRAALGRLSVEQRKALGLAVRQCLVNVLRHSGSMTADVAIAGTGNEVSVSVIDAGIGFVESDTSDDRLGVRSSIRERIERVGGSVTIWSSSGVGTTVLLRVPTEPAADVENGTGAPHAQGASDQGETE